MRETNQQLIAETQICYVICKFAKEKWAPH